MSLLAGEAPGWGSDREAGSRVPLLMRLAGGQAGSSPEWTEQCGLDGLLAGALGPVGGRLNPPAAVPGLFADVVFRLVERKAYLTHGSLAIVLCSWSLQI